MNENLGFKGSGLSSIGKCTTRRREGVAALVYAMFASALPRSGGDYVYIVYIPILHESRAADSRGFVTIATKQIAAEIAKVIPIPCDLPQPIHLASAIAPPPNPVPSV